MGQTIALVPTMGYFHEGHLSLMRRAKERADKVVVSLFVNPTQFGPNEDLDAYPRDAERDQTLARETGVDLLFTPETKAMYAEDHSTWVTVPDLAANLCGRSRPIHFRGVATVVTKLFMLIRPHVAVFGEKDWQQLALIQRMVRDLDMDVRIEGHPIVREPDGLAMSSRNVNLSPEERFQAVHLQQGLAIAETMLEQGIRSADALREGVLAYYSKHISLGELDYCELVHPESITPLEALNGPVLAAVAWRFSRARLLDNRLLG